MGIFSPKYTTSVSSVVYNMAGEEDARNSFIKTTVLSSVLADEDRSIGQDIVTNLLHGPGIKQRQYFKWSTYNYALGMPTAKISNRTTVDSVDIISELTLGAGETAFINDAFIGDGSYDYPAEQWLWDNEPTLATGAWTADYDKVTEEITITHPDLSTDTFPYVFDKDVDMVVSHYYITTDADDATTVEGTLVEDVMDGGTLPDTSGYTTITDTTNVVSDTLTIYTNVTKTYSDATPTSSVDTDDGGTVTNYDDKVEVYHLETYEGMVALDDTAKTVTRRDIINIWETFTIVDDGGIVTSVVVNPDTPSLGVTETVTTTVTTETFDPLWSHRSDTKDLYDDIQGTTQMFIYEVGGGNATLDAYQTDTSYPDEEFFPFIPIRLNNVSITDPAYDSVYASCETAFRRATSSSFSQIIASVEENPDIAQIDFAYIQWGVAINVLDKSAKKYVYNFLAALADDQNTTEAEYSSFLADITTFESTETTYQAWVDAQYNFLDPLYGTVAPARARPPTLDTTTLQIKSDDPLVPDFDQRITWINITETENIVGLGKVDAKKGDIWWESGTADTWTETIGVVTADRGASYTTFYTQTETIPTATLFWQTEVDEYKKLIVRGMYHTNHVYQGHVVTTALDTAINDIEESSFIMPMHYPTMRSMGLVDVTQMTLANTYIVFNTYTVTKQRWYERSIFKILLFIGVVVLSVVFAPAGAVLGGVLGTNAAVGSLLGLTGLAGAIAGAIANALAAMIITKIVTKATVKIFGEKLGGLIGAIVSFVLLNVGASLMSSGQLGMNWGSMMRAENLLKLTKAVGNAYAAYTRGDVLETMEEFDEVRTQYETEMREIRQQAADLGLLGGNGVGINPMMFTDVLQDIEMEHPSTFRERTTMTGDDIVQLSFSMIYDYVDTNLRLPEF